MAEYSYQAIKGKTKTFLAMTGIDLGEFTQLLPYFHQAYREQLVNTFAKTSKDDVKVSGCCTRNCPMRSIILAAINFYKRYLSPYKGFSCAYRVHTGCASCSTLGYRAIRRHGVRRGLALLRERTYRCGVAHRRYSPPLARPFSAQRGDCDMLCPSCELPSLDCDLPGVRQTVDCCASGSSFPCDWPEFKSKRKQEGEDEVHIPKKVRRGEA